MSNLWKKSLGPNGLIVAMFLLAWGGAPGTFQESSVELESGRSGRGAAILPGTALDGELGRTNGQDQTQDQAQVQAQDIEPAFDDAAIRDLRDRLRTLAEQHQGEVAFYVKHLASGIECVHQEAVPMPTASLIKLPIMVEAYRQVEAGQLDLSEPIAWDEADKVPGSGILTSHFSSESRLTMRDLIRLMITYSDNTATNLVLNRIGLASTSETMEGLGLPHTKIHSLTFRRDTSVYPERSIQFGLGSTTAKEIGWLLEQLAAGELISESSDAEMLQHLLTCDDDTKLCAELPPGTAVAHKSGAISNVRCDAGLIETGQGPIVVVVLTSQNQDQSWGTGNAAQQLCATIARTSFDFFGAGVAAAIDDRQPNLSVGSLGRMVEDLQRTLNARLRPSPGLSVDGDFGNNTEQAVLRFQREQGIVETGRVGPETWQALGELLTTDAEVAPPEVVNARTLPREAVDPLEGRPFVTCKSWVIADADSGEVLWNENGSQPRDIASTTKIMTALVAIRMAEQTDDQELWQELVTFSRRADETIGSTSGIREGEQLPLSELLYGLLLPSGNDASVAIAEFLGERLHAADESPSELTPYARFIVEMNRIAEQLGMEQTSFANPHGLTEEGHISSAADLAVLAAEALRSERFRHVVNTRERGARLSSERGYYRNVIWKNTNRLLAIEGYEGVKTGTTNAAGACLVGLASREEQRLLIVILGATSSDARYTDARNLARWAYQQ